MIYNTPETFENVLKKYATNLPDNYDYDTLVNSAYAAFFAFWTPSVLSSAVATDLEKFVCHYFILRRIGVPNEKKWIEIFRNKWRSVIPYFENVLETEANRTSYFTNPISTADMTRSGSNSESGSGSNSQSSSSSETNKYLDTPQGNVTIPNNYITDIREIADSGSMSGQNSNSKEGEFSETKTGYDGKSPSELLKEYRETFLRTYEEIAAELNETFYNLVEFEDYEEFV